MKIFKAHFGRRLKEALAKAGLKQFQLAETLGVKPSAVSRWANGIDFPDDDRLPDLVKAIGVDQSYFVERSDKEMLAKQPTLQEIRDEIKAFQASMDPTLRLMTDMASDYKEERDRALAEVDRLTKALDASRRINTSVPKEIFSAWAKAEPLAHHLALYFLTGNPQYLRTLAPVLHKKMEEAYRRVGLKPAKPRVVGE